ncbi:MAG TPA: PQQ-dependent sugar dehydrogenase [Patescibacteria group bacterium]
MLGKLLVIILLVLLLAGGIAGFIFYRKNFSGIWPAVNPPSSDITQAINTATNNPGENNSNFPLQIPANMTLTIFAKDLVAPRVMVRDQSGNILVSITSEGKVVGISADGSKKTTIVSGLTQPHGLAFLCHNQCSLYIAETNQVNSYDYDATSMSVSNKKKILDLSGGGFHFTRTILFNNKNQLLVSIGSDCNVCDEKNPQRAAIWIADSDGSNFRPYATGLRNSVFMEANPNNGEVWATEMGRDYLGDDLPPDEINIINDGKNYGWPRCYGKGNHDTNFDPKGAIDSCNETEPSFIDLPAHSAPLGLAFWQNSLLVSFHGSWNRSTPTGYKVVKITGDCITKSDSKASCKIEDFITGWLKPGGAVGRPVDLLVDGKKIFISDDKSGVIYLLTQK